MTEDRGHPAGNPGTGSAAALPPPGGDAAGARGVTPDPRPAPRIVDPSAILRKTIVESECRACGHPAVTGHHLIPRSERGDDVPANIIPLCGNGTTRCHGALHGSPYRAERTPKMPCECGIFPEREGDFYVCKNDACDGFDQICSAAIERRDAQWVRARIGERLRPEEVGYVMRKLGHGSGLEYLARAYHYNRPA